MYNIGYFSLLDKKNSEEVKGVTKNYCTVHTLTEKQLDSIDYLDVLVLEDSKPADINKICQLLIEIRKRSDILVWVLSDAHLEAINNRIVYLRLGADGVINHTADWYELSLILKNAIERKDPQRLLQANFSIASNSNHKEQRIPFFKLVPKNLSVFIDNEVEVELTKLEFMAIEYMYENAQKMVTYEEIYRNIWNDDCGEKKYRVSNLIFHLRKKIQANKNSAKYIKTVRSKGYILKV